MTGANKKRPRRPATGLTPKQAAFVGEYLKDKNATQAAVRAGYSAKTANKIGAQLLANPPVAKALEEALAEQAKRCRVTADDILQGLARIAFLDIRRAYKKDGTLKPIKKLPRDVALTLAGIEVDELWDGHGEEREQIGVTKKLKFADRIRALELLGKNLKLFTDKIDLEGKISVERLVLESMGKSKE